nr:hypothetical protein [Tanacetum cinerariifolium]
MHIRNDPSFFLTNKTAAPQGEELGLIKHLIAPSFGPIIPSFRTGPIDKVLMLQVQHQVSNRFGIPLVESEGDSTSPHGILQENLKQSHVLLRFSARDDVQISLISLVASVTTNNQRFISSGNTNDFLGTNNDSLLWILPFEMSLGFTLKAINFFTNPNALLVVSSIGICRTPTITGQMTNSVALVAFRSTRSIMVVVVFGAQRFRSFVRFLLTRPHSVSPASVLLLVLLLVLIVL